MKLISRILSFQFLLLHLQVVVDVSQKKICKEKEEKPHRKWEINHSHVFFEEMFLLSAMYSFFPPPLDPDLACYWKVMAANYSLLSFFLLPVSSFPLSSSLSPPKENYNVFQSCNSLSLCTAYQTPEFTNLLIVGGTSYPSFKNYRGLFFCRFLSKSFKLIANPTPPSSQPPFSSSAWARRGKT